MSQRAMIEGSLRCLRQGWLSLIPVAGVVAAIFGVYWFVVTLGRTKEDWNPARWHLLGGMMLSVLSLFGHALLLAAGIAYLLR